MIQGSDGVIHCVLCQVWSPKQNGGEAELEACVNESKTVDTARVDLSVRRALNLRFLTGQFDPLDQQPFVLVVYCFCACKC